MLIAIVVLLSFLILIGVRIMSALSDLQASVADLAVSVQTAIDHLNTPHPTDAQLVALKGTVDAMKANLDTANAAQ